jgi:E3 ubiquitin-protein ligase SHPRH
VEKNILDLASRQGLSLYTKERSKGTLDVVAPAPDSELNIVDAPANKKQQKGDFITKYVFFLLSFISSYLQPVFM